MALGGACLLVFFSPQPRAGAQSHKRSVGWGTDGNAVDLRTAGAPSRSVGRGGGRIAPNVFRFPCVPNAVDLRMGRLSQQHWGLTASGNRATPRATRHPSGPAPVNGTEGLGTTASVPRGRNRPPQIVAEQRYGNVGRFAPCNACGVRRSTQVARDVLCCAPQHGHTRGVFFRSAISQPVTSLMIQYKREGQ